VFEGLITLANPKKSWVARWQRLDNYVRGVYATKVSGQLPDEIRTTMEEEYRIPYIPYVLCLHGEALMRVGTGELDTREAGLTGRLHG